MPSTKPLLSLVKRTLVIGSLVACTPTTLNVQNIVAPEDYEIVSCEIPGKIQQLGRHVVFQTRRRIIKTTAEECKVRGGEYTLEDPASYATALRKWQDEAENGENKIEAQYYVAQLYERGATGKPEYELAAVWYKKAAMAGYGRAAVNLGRLYENGLGVTKDSVKAAKWYAQAAGIKESDLSLLVSGDSSGLIQKLQQSVIERDQEIQHLQSEYNRVNEQLKQLQQQLKNREQAAEEARQDLENLRRSIELREQQLKRETSHSVAVERLNDELAELKEDLHNRQQEVASRDAELANLRNKFQRLQAKQKPSEGNVPLIELIDPPFISTGGSLGIAVPANKEHTQQSFIGRAIAPEGLRRITVNNKSVPFDQDGRFTVTLPEMRGVRQDEEIRLEIIATDVFNRRGVVTLFVSKTSLNMKPSQIIEKGPFIAIEEINVFGKFHALVIGNDQYSSPYWPDLKNAVNDADAVAKILKERYVFDDVLVLHNATRKEILTTLNKMRKDLGTNDNLLIYYAGHGQLETKINKGYWIPVDADHSDLTQWISNFDISAQLALADIKHILIIADSCYAGTLSRGSLINPRSDISNRTRYRLLRSLSNSASRTVLSSGGEHPVLDEGGGKHSVFAKAFIDILEENFLLLEMDRIYKAIQERVVAKADDMGVQQQPTYYPIRDSGHEGGDFLFIPRPR